MRKKIWLLLLASLLVVSGCQKIPSAKSTTSKRSTPAKQVQTNQKIGKLDGKNTILYALPSQQQAGTAKTLKKALPQLRALYQARPAVVSKKHEVSYRIQTVQLARQTKRYTVLFFLTNQSKHTIKKLELSVRLSLEKAPSFATLKPQSVSLTAAEMSPLAPQGVLLLTLSGELSAAQFQAAETRTVQAFKLEDGE